MQLESRDGFSIREFVQTEVFGSILLLSATIAALVWANSPWDHAYHDLWHTSLTLGSGRAHLTESLHAWVNDGLMAIFFLVVGLEIKRELTVGELSSRSAATLPVCAAAGGVIVPAGIYLAINAGHVGSHGWGIPMATDIAFALGVLALLGNAIPLSLKIFLSTLAIVDDLAAVLVIAIAYTSSIDWTAMGLAAICLAVLIILNRLGIRRLEVYGIIGIVLWVAVFESGIHATIAGVLLALVIPTGPRTHDAGLLRRSLHRLSVLTRNPVVRTQTDAVHQAALAEPGDHVEGASPSLRLEHALHPIVSFGIVPLFALANAGIAFDGSLGDAIANRIALGVIVGLVVGKVIGIMLGSWLPIRLHLASLPAGITWRLLFGLSWLGGVGFTMSIFVTDLAFRDINAEEHQTSARIGILIASLLAGVIGYTLLRRETTKSVNPQTELHV